MKKDNKQRLFEVMGRLDPTFNLNLNEMLESPVPEKTNPDFLPITTPVGSPDDKLFTEVVNQGIDSHLEGFTKSKFEIKNSSLGNRRIFNFHREEIPILLRRLEEIGTPEAQQWKEDIEKYGDTPIFNEGWGRNLAAGAMMGAASLMPMKANAQTQNVAVNNKPNTEVAQDSQKSVYAFMIGIATESASLAMQKSDIDSAGAFKEIAKYYQDLRDGKTPAPLSVTAKKYITPLDNMSKTLDKGTVNTLIQSGMSIQR